MCIPHPERLAVAVSAALLLVSLATTGIHAKDLGDEIVVTASREDRRSLDLVGNTAKIPGNNILVTNHQHVYEIGVQATGTWISRGSGQEHLTAIRSPVLTGPGACGAFLTLEDSIPTRPTGFCNVNQLFEIPTEMAQSVEIIRGPANALYGSNGLHGTINFLMPVPGADPGWKASADVGPDSFYRGKLGWDGSLGKNDMTVGVLADTYDGWRADSGYQQQKGFLRLDRTLDSGELGFGFTATNLNQETAGFIEGEDAYKDPDLRTTNPNPEAFRDADSQRFFVRWAPSGDGALANSDLRVYLRRSEMEFLQHFLPSQPLEQNGQVSGGLMWTVPVALSERSTLTTGLDLEYMDGFVKQFQEQPSFGPFPQGFHYDYDVSSVMAAPYGQVEFPLSDAWEMMLGLRLEFLRYDYDNNMVSGNTADDGVTPCMNSMAMPIDCRYNRPDDRTDDFLNLAPNIGLLYRINETMSASLSLARGFRAPQATELYRLQAGQNVSDLQSETIDSLEFVYRWQTSRHWIEGSAFAMQKDNFIFQDANRFNISDGKTDHWGLEMQALFSAENGLFGGFAATYARHTYDFFRDGGSQASETIQPGNDVDTAPRTLGSARIGYDRPIGLVQLEWVHFGSYFLDAANEHSYGGHNLLNFRAIWRMRENWTLAARINNLADTYYADRADFAFGDYRYFPGRGREFFMQLTYRTL
jgi:iron complex outermembrane receptor protein